MWSLLVLTFGFPHSDSTEAGKDLLLTKRPMSQGVLTCPQTDNNTHVLRVSLHNNGSQDLAAEQGGLETVGESIEAPVAQHSYLVMEGAATERKLWGQEQCRDQRPLPACLPPVHLLAGKSSSPIPHLAPQTCTLLRPRLKPRDK